MNQRGDLSVEIEQRIDPFKPVSPVVTAGAGTQNPVLGAPGTCLAIDALSRQFFITGGAKPIIMSGFVAIALNAQRREKKVGGRFAASPDP